MNRYVKEFFHRGLIFGGFGPIVLGIVYACLDHFLPGFALSGGQLLVAIISVYLLAFVQAGASVFNQIEHWSVPKALLCHFSLLYGAYVLCYLVNDWIPFRWEVIGVFTAIFAVAYLTVWLTVFITVKLVSRKLNRSLQ